MRKGEAAAERIRVYLVDDHPAVLEGLKGVMRPPSFEVVGEALTGGEALRAIPDLAPRVVILDIRLPDMDGLNVLRQVKPQVPGTAFILFTAFEVAGYLAGGIAAGAAGFAWKGESTPKLLDMVRRVAAGESCLPRSYWGPLLRTLDAKKRAAPEEVMKDWSERDVQILHFMAHGQSNARIAKILEMSRGTLLFHIRGIFARLGVADRTHAVYAAMGKGILAVPDFKE